MGSAHIDLDQAAITRLLHGEGARKARHDGAERIEGRWRANIHPKTGESQALLHITEGVGRTYVETGPAGPGAHQAVNLSAWKWLEYGTSKMAAQSPGRRALGEAAAS